MKDVLIRWTLLLACLAAVTAEEASEATRAARIDAERSNKAKELKPDEVSKLEQRLLDFKEGGYLERFRAGYHGFRPKIGNMVNGGGFAIGPEYFRDDWKDGQVRFRASAQISTRVYQKLETALVLPGFAKGRLSAEFIGTHRNYASLQYYGNGPERPKEFRANYRLEDTNLGGTLALHATRQVKLGGTSGYLWTNVGAGTDSRFLSAERAFSATAAPGIDRQPNYFVNGAFAQFDYRDSPVGPKQGGNYVAQYTFFHDNKFDRYGFRKLDIDLQQYIGFLNKTRVIALRAKATLTDSDANGQIPFYLRPILGGSDDLRGFRPFRFSDRNAMVMNAEYRWEIFSGLDGAVFVDAGKVFPRRGLMNFRDLETSVGFGLRFNTRNVTTVRADVAFSHEGFQVWFKFNDVFLPRRFGTGSAQPLY